LKESAEVIYKSISGVRSVVRKLSSERLASLGDVKWCPTQFQRFIPGVDYRVHVVGPELFACEILSDSDDYRYAPSELRGCDLPQEIAEACFRLSNRLHLPLCGIDLRRTPQGEWYCFEVNPSPAYTCFETVSQAPISAAIASMLAGAAACPVAA
jgi:glutathione synthase/RimK-type ligase-like ATP-grasp enzyme